MIKPNRIKIHVKKAPADHIEANKTKTWQASTKNQKRAVRNFVNFIKNLSEGNNNESPQKKCKTKLVNASAALKNLPSTFLSIYF
jgi:predicted nucleotide-binding protein